MQHYLWIKHNTYQQPFKVTGNWATQSEKLKEIYPQLTADDLKYQNGKEYELQNRLEKSLNKKP